MNRYVNRVRIKRFEQSFGLDTALHKNAPLLLNNIHVCTEPSVRPTTFVPSCVNQLSLVSLNLHLDVVKLIASGKKMTLYVYLITIKYSD